MACGGNARGGLWPGMRRGALPEGRAAEAPVWLPHAVIARGHRRSPDPSAPDFLRLIGVHMSECSSTHHKKSEGVCKWEPKCQISRSEIEKEKLGLRWSVTQRTVSCVAAALFTFWRRWWWSRAQPANAGWQLSEAGPPPGLSVGWPSCHLSNDFFILQEELVARGNAPLPARGNPTLGQADAGTCYVCSHITRDQHTLSSCLCFFAFFLPLSTQSSVSPFLLELPFVLGGFSFTSQ